MCRENPIFLSNFFANKPPTSASRPPPFLEVYINQSHTNSSKTFFILFLTPNKTVSKIKHAEKRHISFKSLIHRPPPSARDRRSRHLSRCFLCNPLYKQTNTTYPKHFSFWFSHPINIFLFQNL